MDDDSIRPPEPRRRRQRRSFGAGLALAGLLVTVGLLAAACGGGSKQPGSASAPSTSAAASPAAAGASAATTTNPAAASASSGSNSSGESSQSEELRLAQCMRAHGVPNFPDPPANGAFLSALGASGVNPASPSFQSALQACKQYNPDENLTPAQSAAQNSKALQFTQCMRSHGVPNFPDPSTGPLGEQVMNLRGTGIDPGSPTVQAAGSACQKLDPGSKL